MQLQNEARITVEADKKFLKKGKVFMARTIQIKLRYRLSSLFSQ